MDVGLVGADLVRGRSSGPPWEDPDGRRAGVTFPPGRSGGCGSGVGENDILRSIDGTPVTVNVNPYASLCRTRRATWSSSASRTEPGGTIRLVKVRPTDDESELRYLAWVEEKSGGGREGQRGPTRIPAHPGHGRRGALDVRPALQSARRGRTACSSTFGAMAAAS